MQYIVCPGFSPFFERRTLAYIIRIQDPELRAKFHHMLPKFCSSIFESKNSPLFVLGRQVKIYLSVDIEYFIFVLFLRYVLEN